MHKNKISFLITLFFISIQFLVSSCTTKKEQLTIFHAGSLAIPLKHMSQSFNQKYPNVEIIREAAGSRTCARKISDLGRQADIVFSADSSVIHNLLIPQHATWCLDFTTNEMALVFTPKSKYANLINAKNWPEILLKPEVTYGHSDPNADPCGYRSQLTWQLSEKYYKKPGLYQKLKNKKHFIRPKETDLLALLESHSMDYLFLYRSVAQQHNLPYIVLPDEINLKSAKYADYYKTAKLKISGKKPGEFITKVGKPMVYGFTIPKCAKNKKMALAYVNLVLSEEGQQIMSLNGQPSIVPAQTTSPESIPPQIRR
jgi:molybdate/tungstate transport system substrate-binding protein